jgi:hypothetical protein
MRLAGAAWAAVGLSLAACSGGVSNTDTTGAVTTFTVGGTVTGLSGAGLVLQNNGGDDLKVTASGSFAFPTSLITGNRYMVSVLSQPSSPDQTCAVANGGGIVANGNITTVAIQCTNKTSATDTIGGVAVGVLGSGLVLQDNAGDNLAVSSNGSFTFATALASGMPYLVTVFSPPVNPYQDCVIANAAGTTGGDNVTNVAVSCTTNPNPAYTIGGTASGISPSQPLMLQDNGRDTITVSKSGPFTFPLAIPSGSTYKVTLAATTEQQSQRCTFTNPSGTVAGSNVTSVSVTCVANQSVSVSVRGLVGTGLVLQDNGQDNLSVAKNGTSAFPAAVATGSTYKVTVLTQPTNPTQTCTVANGSGTVGAGNVTTVQVICVTQRFTVGGTVKNLHGTGLMLRDNGGNAYPVNGTGTVTFTLPAIASGATYAVTVSSQPVNPSQTCTVAYGSGTVGAGNVTTVQVTCVTQRFTVGGTVKNLHGTGLMLRDNGGNAYPVNGTGTVTFTLPAIASGATYAVSVSAQPVNPSQICTVTSGSGTVGAGDVTSVQVACVPQTFTISGTVLNLQGTGLVLEDNAANPYPITGTGKIPFALPAIASGSPYAVTVSSQPTNPSQLCTVTNGSGTVGAGKVTGVQVTCVTQRFTVGGTVKNLHGTGLMLRDNGGNAYPVNGTGTVTFTLPAIASGSTYAVTVSAQPVNPSQICTVTSGGSGTVGAGDVTSVQVGCVTQTFTISGIVSGLQGTGLALEDNGANPYLITGIGGRNVPFTLPAIASGSPYAITVSAQPANPSQLCTVTSGGSGTVGAANVTGVQVTCVTRTFTVGGNVARYLVPSYYGQMVLANGADQFDALPGTTTFAFPTPVASGQTYAVTIQNQPDGQSCQLTNGTGTVGAGPVTSVQVNCTYWVWNGGNPTNTDAGVYGTLGTAASTNLPGGREGGVSWTDAAGNLWLFGGIGYDSTDSEGYLNDLWQYKPSTGEWTWMNGSSASGTTSTYGTLGVAAAANTPGGRYDAMSWTDGAGNLWLFGGYGLSVGGGSSDENQGALNDLWKYNPATNLWTWIGGYQAAEMVGVYGTQDVAAAANQPGARASAITWVDKSGNLWLFGGDGYISHFDGSGYTNQVGALNDLWKYSTASGLWTWVSGSSNDIDDAGVYGTLGTPAAGNVPGARIGSVSWTDASGNLWLFGGETYLGLAQEGGPNYKPNNDLWRFNTTSSLWTYMSGSTTPDTAGAYGIYGTKGVPAAANVPTARDSSVSWVDAAGNFWLFGGNVYAVVTLGTPAITTQIDDVWEYVPATNQWTWVAGSNSAQAAAVYGTQGVPAIGTTPGARNDAMRWVDAAGNLWLFGGYPINEPTDVGYVSYPNDMWKFVPFNLAP